MPCKLFRYCFVSLVVLLVSCPLSLDPDAGFDAAPSLVVDVSSSVSRFSRTIVPDFGERIARIQVILERDGYESRSAERSTVEPVGFFNLATGLWTVRIELFDSADMEIGSGSVSVNINGTAQTVRVPVSMYRGSSGSFSIPVRWPLSSPVDGLSWSLNGTVMDDPDITEDGGF